METFVAKVRKWGNSKGVILPARITVAVGEDVLLNVQRTAGVTKVKDAFGKVRAKSNTASSLREIDEEFRSKFD